MVLPVKMGMEETGWLAYVIVNTYDDHVFHAHNLLLFVNYNKSLLN